MKSSNYPLFRLELKFYAAIQVIVDQYAVFEAGNQLITVWKTNNSTSYFETSKLSLFFFLDYIFRSIKTNKVKIIAWCELNEGDDNLVVAINNVMLPNKDNCIALKNVLIVCKDSQCAWQIISFKNCSDN